MALPFPYSSMCELPSRTANIGLQEWQFTRRFRVITANEVPPVGPLAAIGCPGIPPFGSSYVDFISNETVPNAILINYEPEPQPSPREWIVTCVYSNQQRQPVNSGSLQSQAGGGGGGGGGGSSNPDDPTQLLPKVSTGAEMIRVPYQYDLQNSGRYKDANDNTIVGGSPVTEFTNTACEKFAAGMSFEVALETYQVSLYRTGYNSYNAINNCVNANPWSGFQSRSLLLKPVRQSRERFGSRWFWLNNYEFVYDPHFFHTFTVLNAGFRELTAPIPPLAVLPRTLRDITNNGVRTSVEWPLSASGQKITDPGKNGANLIYAEFNKHFSSVEFQSRIPFLLSDFGIL